VLKGLLDVQVLNMLLLYPRNPITFFDIVSEFSPLARVPRQLGFTASDVLRHIV